jgi:spore coat polysaccharide biosynthesis predicted glycosyltransferase SpsG
MRIIFIVPARGGDREVPYLNTKSLGGLPLIAHTLIEARKSRHPHTLVVSTDSDEVARVAELYGASVPFRRPDELASDSAKIQDIVRHAVTFVERKEKVRFDVIVTLQATSPFRTGRQIDEAIDKLLEGGFDSVISLKEIRSLTWRKEGGTLVPVFERAGRREELEPLYQEDGAIRVMRREVLDSGERLGARVGHVLMDKMSALTVHDIYDFWLAERLAHLPRVLFRVDGGGEIGMGHVVRSLAAADALVKLSPTADVCFLMRADRPEGVQHVSKTGRAVRVLADSGADVLSAIRDYSPNIVVNDLPFLEDSYLRSLATLGASTVNFVDTLADIEKPTEMATVIIAALAEGEVELDDYHAGPAYAILRESFQNRAAEVSERGRKVVLTFGGSDPQKLTLKALEAIGPLLDVIPELSITAVLGPAFGHAAELEELRAKLSYKPRILERVEHMADILVDADLVLCSGGMTVLEIAALGRPGLVLCQNAREESRMKTFARAGSIVHLGLGTEVSQTDIRERARSLLMDRAARLSMSEAGAKLVDARGASNAAQVLIQAGRRGPANGGRRE